MEPRRILFVPVSSLSGIGEYMRSMVIANALQSRWPNVDIHFILNEQVPYRQSCPYIVHTCNGSPTQDALGVNRTIKSLKPDLVLFDASGRACQFKQAKKVGAKVAFISQHNKKRSRGLKLNRLFNIDTHWVAQPDFCIKPLSLWQRSKLAFFNKNSPQNIGSVYEMSASVEQQEFLQQYDLIKDDFIVFNAGSGGHKVKDELAIDIYYQAAQVLQRLTPMKCVVIFGGNYPKEIPNNPDIVVIKTIANKNFVTLLSNAYCCVISAGDTLLQCIDLAKPCVVSAVSPDQPARLKVCHNEKLVIASDPHIDNLVEQTLLLMEPENRNQLIEKMKSKTCQNALTTIVNDIALLFSSHK